MLDMNQIKKNVSNWSKTENEVTPGSTPVRKQETTQPIHQPAKGPATIGASIRFKGELSGEEDFIIQGVVEGRITLTNNNLTIGNTGRIKADIIARTIIVEGELLGDLMGEEKVIIRKTGRVRGNIVSPRVTLEDGAKFKGSIEMDPQDTEASVKPDSTNKTENPNKSGPENNSPDRKRA